MNKLAKIIENRGRTVICLQVSRRGNVTVWKEWNQCPDLAISEALCRLAAYEDTGLEPEELTELIRV